MLVKVAQTQLKVESPAFKELASSVLQASRHTMRTHPFVDGMLYARALPALLRQQTERAPNGGRAALVVWCLESLLT